MTEVEISGLDLLYYRFYFRVFQESRHEHQESTRPDIPTEFNERKNGRFKIYISSLNKYPNTIGSLYISWRISNPIIRPTCQKFNDKADDILMLNCCCLSQGKTILNYENSESSYSKNVVFL